MLRFLSHFESEHGSLDAALGYAYACMSHVEAQATEDNLMTRDVEDVSGHIKAAEVLSTCYADYWTVW